MSSDASSGSLQLVQMPIGVRVGILLVGDWRNVPRGGQRRISAVAPFPEQRDGEAEHVMDEHLGHPAQGSAVCGGEGENRVRACRGRVGETYRCAARTPDDRGRRAEDDAEATRLDVAGLVTLGAPVEIADHQPRRSREAKSWPISVIARYEAPSVRLKEKASGAITTLRALRESTRHVPGVVSGMMKNERAMSVLVLSVLDVALVFVVDEEVETETLRVRFADPAQGGTLEPVEARGLEAFASTAPDARAQTPAVRQQRRQAIRPRRAHQGARFVETRISRRGLEATRRRPRRQHSPRGPSQRRRRGARFRLQPLRQSVCGVVERSLHR